MYGGEIYEEGTPQQIFDAPQKPVTKAFVNRIRSLSFRLENRHYDLYGMFGQIETFCSKYGLGNVLTGKVQHVIEEMLSEILPFTGPVSLELEYSEKTYGLSLQFTQENASAPILSGMDADTVSLMLVRGMSKSVSEPENGLIRVEF